MWNDNETKTDLIDFTHLVGATISVVDDPRLLPATIGIFGNWGSGKSSLMKMIEDHYSGTEGILSVRFNGWLFEGYEDAKTALMTRILEETIKNRTLEEKAKKVASRLIKNIDILKLAKTATVHGLAYLATGGIGNIALALKDLIPSGQNVLTGLSKSIESGNYDAIIENMARQTQNEAGINEFYSDFQSLLDETKISKLIVLIDDLDRCSPNTVIETLEAIKLFLFTPNTVFIIGADERLIEYSVKRKYPEIPGEKDVSRDYLEKLIQIPIRIPSLSEIELETFINLLFAQKHITDPQKYEELRIKIFEAKKTNLFNQVFNAGKIQEYIGADIPDLKKDLILSAQITPILSSGLNGNPRQCKRFLNTLLLRMQMASSKGIEIEKRILAKIMLLEHFKNEAFKFIQTRIDSESGILKEFEGLEKNRNTKEIDKIEGFEHWEEDTWLNNWLDIEPSLSGIDLRPYYYFSRDNINLKSRLFGARVSDEIQAIVRNFLSGADSLIKKSLLEVSQLSHAEASIVFKEVSEKINQEEDPIKRTKLIKVCIEIAKVKPELKSELLTLLSGLLESQIMIPVVPLIVSCFEDSPFKKQMIDLLEKWKSNTSNLKLAKAAERTLPKIK